MKHLKRPLWPSLAPALASLILPVPGALGQDAPAEEEEVFWLSPFEVVTEGDSGYERVNAGTATRISMDIIDTPLSIQVVSEEFLRDTGRTELVDVFDYSSSIDTNPDNVMRNDDIKVRGFGVSFVLRDGFKKYYDAPLEAVDRVEVVKGPNAVFFGQAQPGGVINYITKNPLWDPYYEARIEIGNDNHFKAWADATGPITDWMAYRLITSYRDSDSWKDNTSMENEYVFSSFTIRPLRKVEITGNYEYNDTFREGGIRTAIVGNRDYFRDYYANEGRDFGYAVNWDEVPLEVFTESRFGMETRYPWPVAGLRELEPPETGFGGINPRWDGTITPALTAFFNGDVPEAFLQWNQPDQSIFPEYQRNVTLPFQYDQIELFSEGNRGTNYRPGWRMLKWFAGGMENYPDRFTGPVFPNGYDWNANGKGSFHDTEHHIATVKLTAELLEWLDFRYAGNYLENSFLRVQQFNSDPDMDGFTLAPGQGFGTTAGGSISGAAVNEFRNSRYTHQADLTAEFEFRGTTHTFLASGELRQDKFLSYAHDRTDYYFENVLRPLRLFPDGSPRSFAFQPGVANWDIFADEPDDLSQWVDLDSRKPDVSTSNYLEEVALSSSYRGTFLNERLSVLAGVRWEERADFGYDGETVGGLKGERVSDVTPMIGVNYELKSGLTVYGSYSESFVPPSRPQSRNTVTFYDGPMDEPVEVTEDVDPLGVERGVGYEGGFKASGFNNKLSGTLTAFHLERQNIVVTDSNLIERLRQNYLEYDIPWDPTIESGGSALRKNSGIEVSEGLEMDVLYRFQPNWTFNVSFSWLWKAEFESPDAIDFFGDVNLPVGSDEGPYPHSSLFSDELLGTYTIPSTGQVVEVLRPLSATEMNAAISEAAAAGTEPVNPYTGEKLVFEPIQHRDLAEVSQIRFSIWSLYEFQEGRLEGLALGTGANYQSKQRPVQDRDFDYWNPGFWIFDAMLRYEVPVWDQQVLTLQLNLNNVFERRAVDSGGFGINAPRTWKLTATMKF